MNQESNGVAEQAMLQIMQANKPVAKSNHYLAELHEEDLVMSRAVRRRIDRGAKKDQECLINQSVDEHRQKVLVQRRRLAFENKRVQAGVDTEIK